MGRRRIDAIAGRPYDADTDFLGNHTESGYEGGDAYVIPVD